MHHLYSFRRCPYAMRARLAIAASGLMVELREVVLRNKPEAMLLISPKGTVPVLHRDDGSVIDESLDIALWALNQRDPKGLLPKNAGHQKEFEALITQNDGPFKHHLDRAKYGTRYPEEDPAKHRTAASEILMTLDQRLAEQNFLLGDKRSIADITIAPFIRQFANIDRNWFDAQSWPHLLKWLETFLNSPEFQSIMTKYPPWQEGDEPIIFPAGI